MCIKRNAICNTTCTDSKATTKLVVVHTSYYLYIVLVLQLLVRVMLVPKVDAKSGEAAALVVFQVALVVLVLACFILLLKSQCSSLETFCIFYDPTLLN